MRFVAGRSAAADGAKRKSTWTRLPMRGIPQPENHRPRTVPLHAPLAMDSVDGATKMAAPSTQPPSGRPSEQGRRGRSFSTCRLVANCRLKAFSLEYCISTNFHYICENTFRMSNKYLRILLLISREILQ